jgi:hypothetical protein
MTENNMQTENERIILFQRLMQKKEQLLQVSCEIEDLRKQFLNQEQNDEEGIIESEIYKKIYTILECMSELAGYTQGRGLISLHYLINHFSYYRLKSGSIYVGETIVQKDENYKHIALSPVLDAMCIAVNCVNISWNFKREPSVAFEKIDGLNQILKLYK